MKDTAPAFILWDRKNGPAPHVDNAGKIVSSGAVGVIDKDNAFLTAYGKFPDARRPVDLAVGSCIEDVSFSLSGGHGSYAVYRVR